MQKTKVVRNTAMLSLMSAAKIIFPFLTLPYLTRVLSVPGYATVSYVKSAIQYAQLTVDFGFMLSTTRELVGLNKDEKVSANAIISDTVFARLLLAGLAFLGITALIPAIAILRENILYTYLSFIPVVLSCFLLDFYFRAIEQMQEVSLRFVLMKGISTVLTFFVVRSDAQILWIPILDIISSLAAIVLVFFQLKKYGCKLVKPSFRSALKKIKVSFTYFLSNFATTAFGALNTILIGIFLPECRSPIGRSPCRSSAPCRPCTPR